MGDKHPDARKWLTGLSIEDVEEVFQDELCFEDCSPEEVSEICLTSPRTVRRVRRLTGRDPETGYQELDDRLCFLVELHHDYGMTVQELAKFAGLSNSTVGRIVKGEARLPKHYDGVDVPELLAERSRRLRQNTTG